MMVYGCFNGKEYYTEESYVHAIRNHGSFDSDEELIAFAEKVTGHWYCAGWRHTFTTFYLSDYACSEPYHSLTRAEFKRLKELQDKAIEAERAAEEAREWRKVETWYYADNSVEEIWEDKDGNRKTEMAVGPHGDAC